MLITPNFDEVEQAEFTPIESGSYDARITDVVNGDNAVGSMLKITYQLVGGDYPNRLVWDNVHFTGKRAWVFKKFHKSLTGEEFAPGQQVDTELYAGREVTINVVKNLSPDGSKAYANVRDVVLRG